ncbi:MAG: aldolase/citrate lyase family protein [Campylobacterota bacterium]|nr:aldolase/citrate lyase family protein [Campylobacterota bacterium]
MIAHSALMVAGDKPKHLNKLQQLKCHIAIVNLEDGVYDKDTARSLVCQTLKDNSFSNTQIVVRINDLKLCGKEDIDALNKVKPYAIRIPKIRTLEDVQLALDLIDKDIQVHLSIETKEALQNLHKFKIHPRVTTVYLGILDMLESLGLAQNLVHLNNPTVDYILSKFLIDSRTAGLYPISFVYQEYQNTQEFTQWCRKEKNMGFSAKACISPTQVKIANEIFSRNTQEIQKAKQIIKLFEEQKAKRCTGFAHEKYGFIDEPIYKDALLVLKNS